jgi:hypothetical protein
VAAKSSDEIEMGNARARTYRSSVRWGLVRTRTWSPLVVFSVNRRVARRKLPASESRWNPTTSAPSSPSTTCLRQGSCVKISTGGNGMWWK